MPALWKALPPVWPPMKMHISHQMKMMSKIWNVPVADMNIVNVRTKIFNLEIILGADLAMFATRIYIVVPVTMCIVAAHMAALRMYVTDCVDFPVNTAQCARLVCAIITVVDQIQIQMTHSVVNVIRNTRIVCVMLTCNHTRMRMRRKRKKKMMIQV
jgi:hypothetical protein